MLAAAVARAAAARDSYHHYRRAPDGRSKRGESRDASNTHGGGRSATVQHGRHIPDGGRRRGMAGQRRARRVRGGGWPSDHPRAMVEGRIPAKRKSGSCTYK